MEITVVKEQGRVPVTIFNIKGEINAETSDTLLDAARHAYAEGTTDLLLDLSEVPYISSWGIRALSQIYSMLRSPEQAGASQAQTMTASDHFKLLKPTPQVQRVLSMVGLDIYLQTYTDRHTAVASY